MEAVYKVDESDAFRHQPPTYAPGFSALRIENNCPPPPRAAQYRSRSGLALHAVGTGPFSILGNHFSTGGTVSVDAAGRKDLYLESAALADVGTLSGALTVSIMNLGLSLEAFDRIKGFADLYAAKDRFGDGSADSLSVTNGTVLFSNNICQADGEVERHARVSSVGPSLTLWIT